MYLHNTFNLSYLDFYLQISFHYISIMTEQINSTLWSVRCEAIKYPIITYHIIYWQWNISLAPEYVLCQYVFIKKGLTPKNTSYPCSFRIIKRLDLIVVQRGPAISLSCFALISLVRHFELVPKKLVLRYLGQKNSL